MNRVILLGRLTRDCQTRYSTVGNTQETLCIARFTLAVDRRTKDDGADFISCVVFGKSAEAAEKYLNKGSKIALCGRIQSGSYTNQEGKKIYTTDVIVESWEFAESKSAVAGDNQSRPQSAAEEADSDGFMNIPEGIEEELPFS